MSKFLFFILSLTFLSCAHESIELSEVTIYRDTWGVPHIHARTDELVAYGLAWASCEDDFVTIQEQMAAIKGVYGEMKGREGLIADFAIAFMGLRDEAEAKYRDLLSPKMIAIIEHYADGANAFAELHPDEVIDQDIWPVEPADIIAGYMLGLVEISGAAQDLQKIMNGEIVHDLKSNFPKGSNAIAVNDKLSKDGRTYLAINSHQPLEGWYSWYEAHLISDEGQNILGGTFPGGATIFHGTNPYLGWAHTVNFADFSDVYRLNMHPDKKYQYQVDGEWYELEKKHVWSWMKLAGPITIPIRQTKYSSMFGPTFKTDDGVFAWRFVAHDAVAAIEQWYQMNRATNLTEFKTALERQDMPCTNIVYADRDDNILYISNAKIPVRSDKYEWQEVLPGDTRETLWDDGYWPLDSVPQVLNPTSGMVFNTNNTPFTATTSDENDTPDRINRQMGYQDASINNNRSRRMIELYGSIDSIDYQTFKRFKFDRRYPQELSQAHIINQELILHMDPLAHPSLSESISLLNNWDRSTDPDSRVAAIFTLTVAAIKDELKKNNRQVRGNVISEVEVLTALARADSTLRADFGRVDPPLSEVLRHRRGEVDLPLWGGNDVLAAIYGEKEDDGRYRAAAGESYIQLVQFTDEEYPIIESIHAYGASADPESPHYTDQMELFARQELKPMSLDLSVVRAQADTSYHPMKIIH